MYKLYYIVNNETCVMTFYDWEQVQKNSAKLRRKYGYDLEIWSEYTKK